MTGVTAVYGVRSVTDVRYEHRANAFFAALLPPPTPRGVPKQRRPRGRQPSAQRRASEPAHYHNRATIS